MIQGIVARNVNEALSSGFWLLKTCGQKEMSRNGPVIVMPDPVTTTYLKPRERLLWNEVRDANPFFHLMECIWMMAGRNDVEWVAQFNKNMWKYAEEDGRQHGAYGYRWRTHFGTDQLVDVIYELQRDKYTRRAVMAMWDPVSELGNDKNDLPCNTTIYFRVSPFNDELDMTVCCRSNDILWGAYGANAVHFSFLLEVVAYFCGYNVGRYHQFSNNFHAYLGVPAAEQFLTHPPAYEEDPYREGQIAPKPIFNKDDNDIQSWLNDCERFCEGASSNNEFLETVAAPMRDYYLSRKNDNAAIDRLRAMPQCDWKYAALRWAERRLQGDRLGRQTA